MKLDTEVEVPDRRGSGLTLPRFLGPVLVSISFVSLAIWSWGKWADPLIDFGRELYTPWRLVEGGTLGQDVATLFGPASQYFNAGLFQLFGTHVWTLYTANLCLLFALTAIIYCFVERISNALTATVCALVQLSVFSFSQYFVISGYNFVAPYAHEATHGLFLVCVAVGLGEQYLRTNRWGFGVGAGLCCGLALLTKLEPALAACALVGAIFIIALGRQKKSFLQVALALLLPFSIPVLGWVLVFAQAVGWTSAWQQALGAFAGLAHPSVGDLEFYRTISGLGNSSGNLLALLKVLAGCCLVIGCLAFADRWLQKRDSMTFCLATLGGVLGVLLLARWAPWFEVARILPVISLVACVLSWFLVWSKKQHADSASTDMLFKPASVRSIGLALWSTTSLAFLAKTVLWTRFVHYGFSLSLMATLLLIIILTFYLPNKLYSQYGGGAYFRFMTIGLVLAGALQIWLQAHEVYSHKTEVVVAPHDQLYVLTADTDPRSETFAKIVRMLEERTKPSDTLAVLPEGVMLNYLLRQQNPTPYINYMPPEVLVFGEEKILTAWQANPPNFVLHLPKDTTEYGAGQFGSPDGYADSFMGWVSDHYRVVERIAAAKNARTKEASRITPHIELLEYAPHVEPQYRPTQPPFGELIQQDPNPSRDTD